MRVRPCFEVSLSRYSLLSTKSRIDEKVLPCIDCRRRCRRRILPTKFDVLIDVFGRQMSPLVDFILFIFLLLSSPSISWSLLPHAEQRFYRYHHESLLLRGLLVVLDDDEGQFSALEVKFDYFGPEILKEFRPEISYWKGIYYWIFGFEEWVVWSSPPDLKALTAPLGFHTGIPYMAIY